MAKRWSVSNRKSRRDFSRKAMRLHPKNTMDGASLAMRGGIRL